MGGFFDYLRMLLGWWAAGPALATEPRIITLIGRDGRQTDLIGKDSKTTSLRGGDGLQTALSGRGPT